MKEKTFCPKYHLRDTIMFVVSDKKCKGIVDVIKQDFSGFRYDIAYSIFNGYKESYNICKNIGESRILGLEV